MKPLAQNTLIQNRYLVVHLIGKGGMGEVYLAVDQRLGSAVALKRTFFAGDEMLGNAFEREARTLARMRHPVLPKVSDHFGEGDEQYLVMEHISGDDLSKRLEAAGKPFPVSWVLFWADQLLDALSYLHTHEPPIIHRDIKPQNLKLTDENSIILLDFGLSKTSTGQTNISQSGSTGSIVGYTPHYAPMEQIRGIGTSPRSDLYSLSATLYQLLTNTVPTDALTRADAMLNGLSDPITPPHEINPEVPEVVSGVILRGMEVSQEKRYANAREMQRVLRKAFNELQQATSASTVAFTSEQAAAAGVVVPEQLPMQEAVDSKVDLSVSGGQSQSVVDEPPPVETEPEHDFDATVAYSPPVSDPEGTNQAGIKTEVFIAGAHEFSEAGPASVTEEPVDRSFESQSGSKPFSAEATVPFIALDPGLADVPAAPPAESVMFDRHEAFEADGLGDADGPQTSEFRPVTEEPVESAVAAAPAVPAAARPQAKKSSGKALAVAGGLAALLLLAVVVGGGIWAYMEYGGGRGVVAPTPEPTPEQTVFETPTPEPTIESNTNTDLGNSSNSLVNTNSNSILVEPTPERRPDDDQVPGGERPTPRPQSTPRSSGTPVPRPTPRRTPAVRPTVLP